MNSIFFLDLKLMIYVNIKMYLKYLFLVILLLLG